jgi:four helix bundle protein
MKGNPMFDHEKLDVYQVELRFIAWSAALLTEVKRSADSSYHEVRDQLDRASLSALLNSAEGNGKRQGRERARFFDNARGSAVECAACLDAMVAKGLAAEEQIGEGKAMLLRIVGMLCKLVDRFAVGSSRIREEAGIYEPDSLEIPLSPRRRNVKQSKKRTRDEHEDEDEGKHNLHDG